jgi:hypothetical protein
MLVTGLARDISNAKPSGIGIEVPSKCFATPSSFGINRVGAGHFAVLPPLLFSEMSPSCFRPAFDGIGVVWFTPNVVERRSERDGGGTGGFFGTSSIFNSRLEFQRSGIAPLGLEFGQNGWTNKKIWQRKSTLKVAALAGNKLLQSPRPAR